MTFCYSPWTNVDITPAGDINPCAKFLSNSYDKQYNIKTDTLTDYADSDIVANIKKDFLNGTWPKGCDRCKIEEENNIKSKRILDNERWSKQYQVYKFGDGFITAGIAFGNTCNLQCITCNPYSSSRWRNEHKLINGIDVTQFKFYKENFVNDFLSTAPNIKHLDIPGGEPFLSGVNEQHQLLKYYIDHNKASGITLHYTTNGTIYPDAQWWELWNHFKEVDIQISIDGVGDHYEYIRWPGQWPTLVDTVTQYIAQEKVIRNLRLSVSHTVSAYNIFYLDEFFSWCYTIGLPRPWLGRVHNPPYMRPSVWQLDARKHIVDRLRGSNNEDVNVWAELVSSSDDSEYFDQFKNKLMLHDQYRNLDFAETFPEMASYIK